jgi:phosphodiesterase/alkaline phosphatase D-like protein
VQIRRHLQLAAIVHGASADWHAHSFDQFRGNYKYNLLDHNLRAFNAEVPMLAEWDDHDAAAYLNRYGV